MSRRDYFGRNPKEGACNAPVDDAGWTRYCHRPDNVHQAAKKRGERTRAENLRLRMRRARVSGYE